MVGVDPVFVRSKRKLGALAVRFEMASGDSDMDLFEPHAGGAFGSQSGFVNGFAGQHDVNHLTAAKPPRGRGPDTEDMELRFSIELPDDDGRLGGPNIEADDDISPWHQDASSGASGGRE